ncbi:hypothetical protein FBU30_004919 [Linnemannia zychae]|nr:hypothetical protein FBU30_004919 [Linnemannia zychae]
MESKSDLEQQTQESGNAINRIPTLTGIRRICILSGLTLGCLMVSHGGTIAATGLPRISSEFNIQSQMARIATAYLLSYTSFLPLYGQFSDIFGLKAIYLFISFVFLVGSDGSDDGARFQLLGCIAYGVARIAGPLVGGVMIEHSNWRCLGTKTLAIAVRLFILFDEYTSLTLQIIFVPIMGFGQGFIFQNCLLACQDCSDSKDIAVATLLITFVENIGVTICGVIMNNLLALNFSWLPESSQESLSELNVIENVNLITLLSPELHTKVTLAHMYTLILYIY